MWFDVASMAETACSQKNQRMPGLRDHYERDGFVHIRNLLASDEVAQIRAAFDAEALELAFDDGVPETDVLRRWPRSVHPHRRPHSKAGALARAYMTDPRLLNTMHDVVGEVLGAQSMFYFKPPGARGQALHQDNLFLQAHPETCHALWIAIDDCDADNGGLQVVPGSHHVALLCPEPADPELSFASITVPVPSDAVRHQTVMAAGDALVFHGAMVHGSLPNTTDDRFRRSLIYHYIPADSTEIAQFYLPLIARDGSQVLLPEATGGGPCGTSWDGLTEDDLTAAGHPAKWRDGSNAGGVLHSFAPRSPRRW